VKKYALLLICCTLISFFACKKYDAVRQNIIQTDSNRNLASQKNYGYSAQNNQYDEGMNEFEYYDEFDNDYYTERARVYDLIINEGGNAKYDLTPLFIKEINFGISGGKNWFALLPDISGKIDDDWLNMYVYVINYSQGITRKFYARSTNPVLINRPDILREIPGIRYAEIQSFVINDFNNDGHDEILSYILLPPRGNHNYFSISKYDSENDEMWNEVLKVEFNLIANNNNFSPIEYKEIDGRLGFRIYTVMDDGSSKWLFYTWDNETRRYEEITKIIANRSTPAVVLKPLPSWTTVSNSTFGASYIAGIKYINNYFVAVGYDGKMAYSKDGKTWTAVKDGASSLTVIRGVAYGNKLFVVGGKGDNGKIAYSKDLTTWTVVSDNTLDMDYIIDIEYGNKRFIAVDDGGKIAYSDNGIKWTSVKDKPFDNKSISSVTYGNNRFVAVGDEGRIAHSKDGITWTAVSNTYRTFGKSDIFKIVYANDCFVAVGQGGKIGYSKDGIIWNAVTNNAFPASDNVLSVAYGKDRFVATSVDGKIAYSADGITWTAVTNTPFGKSNISFIAYGKNCFVAVNNVDEGKIAYCDW
jgi:photosystem II stability/assembly factor-like uncharacterized protein